MTTFHESDAFDEPVRLQELQDRLSELSLSEGLQIVTKLASRQLWFPDDLELAKKVNLVSLSLLAKAVVLYSAPDGRSFDTSLSDSNDLKWLLKAINSMSWYPRDEYNADNDSTIISFLMRQAYARHSVAEHPAPAMVRAFSMFHEHLPPDTANELDDALRDGTGLSRTELWTLCSAIYTFYFIETVRDGGPWVITPDFFASSSKSDELQNTLRRALSTIAKTPQELRTVYNSKAKYHDGTLPEEYWLSEFNILRDFPVVAIGEDKYCCPFPIFAWVRGAIGYYFDLVTQFAEKEKLANPKNPNPFDNRMGQIVGGQFQEYVGRQLRELSSARDCLRPEFKYQIGKDELDSPDWLLERVPDMPVLFECKARRPTLGMQARCTQADREGEANRVISRALAQLCTFLRHAEDGKTGAFQFGPDKRCVYALVLYDPFPFHALPAIRGIIDAQAEKKAAEWANLKKRVDFVPLSVQELELACLVEQHTGELLEHQLQKYARYRSNAKTRTGNTLAQHFYEFALNEWNLGSEIMPRLSHHLWDRWCELAFNMIFGESLAEYEGVQKRRWIAESAYFRWINADKVHGHDVEHWIDAEREFETLSQQLGMAPYQEFRLRPHRAIQRGAS